MSAQETTRPKPRAIEFDIGKDAYGRPVTLRGSRGSDGAESWEIRREAGGQRDESERVSGLTADNIRAIAAAVE